MTLNLEYKNSQGKIQKSIFNIILTIVFFSYILLLFSFRLLNLTENILRFFLYFYYFLSFIKLIILKGRIDYKAILWYFVFIVLALFSFYYSASTELFLSAFSRVVQAFLFIISMSVFFQISNSENKITNIFIISAFITSIIVIYLYNPLNTTVSWDRLGSDFGVNPNDFGLLFTISFIFLIRQVFSHKKKILMLLISVFFLYVILLTGSKKALFGSLIFILSFLLLQKSSPKKFVYVLLFSFSLIVTIQLIYNTEIFYNIIGNRIDSFILSFTNNDFDSTSGSNYRRLMMISEAFDIFSNSPIFGIGLNNYAYYQGVYSHNNYLEILTSLGLLGFSAFYSIYFLSLFRLAKNYIRDKHEQNVFYLALLMTLLFFDLSTVSYHNIPILLLIIMMFRGRTIEMNNAK